MSRGINLPQLGGWKRLPKSKFNFEYANGGKMEEPAENDIQF